MGFLKSLTKPIKKVASVTIAAGAGFVGGGGVGALAGATKGVIANTKTSKAAPVTLRYAGQSFATGAITNIAAGAALAGVHAIGAAGAAGTAGGAKTGLLSKALAFGKSGGVAGNLGNIFKAAGTGIGNGFNAISALNLFNSKKQGAVPGETASPEQTTQGFSNVGNIVRSGYGQLRENPKVKKGLKDFAAGVQNGGGWQGGIDKVKESFHFLPSPENAPQSAPIILGGMGGDNQQLIILAVLALGAFFLLRSGKFA